MSQRKMSTKRDRSKNKDSKLIDMLYKEAEGTTLFGFAFKAEVNMTDEELFSKFSGENDSLY